MQYYSHMYQLMSKRFYGAHADKTCMQRSSRYEGGAHFRTICCVCAAYSKVGLEAKKKSTTKKQDEVGADHIGPCIVHLTN